MPDLEVVVVDGASTDGTWELLQERARLDPRIRIFQQRENLGPVPGWSECLEHARGTYATFLWSDDLIKPTFLEKLLPLLAADSVGLAFTAAEIGPTPGKGAASYANSGVIPATAFVRRLAEGDPSLPVSPACALFRLSDLRRSLMPALPTSPPFDLRRTGAGTDLLLYALTAQRYRSVVAIPEVLAFFRAHPGSISIDGRAGLVNRSYAVTRAYLAKRGGLRDLRRRTIARQWLIDIRDADRRWPITAVPRYGSLATAPELVLYGALELLKFAARSLARRTHARETS